MTKESISKAWSPRKFAKAAEEFIRDHANVTKIRHRSRKNATRTAKSAGEQVTKPVHGLYVHHVMNPEIERHFARLVRETEGRVIWHPVFNPGNRASPETDLDYSHAALSMPWRFSEMDQHGGILPAGLVDLTILPSILATGAPFVWVMEFDVDYAGHWGEFFDQFENNTADLLTTNVTSHRENPDWFFWSRVEMPPQVHPVQRIRSFTPFMRFSQKFARAYVETLRDSSWKGHYEFVLPMIATTQGFVLEDLGGESRFCPPSRYGKVYTSTRTDPTLGPGTFIWRPVFEAYYEDNPEAFTKKGMVYHPCKPGGAKLYSGNTTPKKMKEKVKQQDEARPKTAVVMATFNGARHLQELLDSLSDQSRKPDELIISDDASEDETVAIARKFAETAPFAVKIIENATRLGYSDNVIKAAKHTDCELLLFCDQDDVWHPQKVRFISNAAFDTNYSVFSHDLAIFRETLKNKDGFIPSYFDYLKQLGVGASLCSRGGNLAVRSDFIEQFGWPGKDLEISHDAWIALLATALGECALVDAPLVKHRLHKGDASGWIMSATEEKKMAKAPIDQPFALLLDFYMMKNRLGWIAPLQDKLRTVGMQINPERATAAFEALEARR